MERIRRYLALGWRWTRCGWRLFQRNPWLLGGMGLCCAAFFVVLAHVPLVGGPFIGLLAPSAVASFYIAIDGVSRQKMKLPRALRLPAIKQAPREFLNVARQETHLMQVLLLGLYGLVALVLTDIVVWLVAGPALASPLAGLSITGLLGVIAANLLRFAIYLLLIASLAFTVPLVLLQNRALVPAMVDGVVRGMRYGVALLVLLALLLVPLLLGVLASVVAGWLGYLFGIASATALLPIALAGLYCSYRTVFTTAQPVTRIDAAFKRAGNYV